MIIDYLKCPWRTIPSIQSLWTDDSVAHIIIAEHPEWKHPVLIAKDLSETFADHIVELHNNSIGYDQK